MKLISELSSQQREQLIDLYIASFPPEERRPEGKMFPAAKSFRFCAIERNGQIVGLLSYWVFDAFNYIEHFAIIPELRGLGFGSDALQLLSDPIVLEVEPPESGVEAARRLQFYLRNGFRVLTKEYTQPPYSAGLSSVRLWLLVRGNLKVDVSEVITTLHQEVYRQNR